MTFSKQAKTCPQMSNRQPATRPIPDLARMGVGKRSRGLLSRTPVAAQCALLWLLTSAVLSSGALATPPPNDHLGDIQLMTGFPTSALGSNVDASKSPGAEPTIVAGNAGGRSVWYEWIAEVTGVVEIFTCGATFNTLLGVYTGSFDVVAENDDEPGCAPMLNGSSRGSLIRFHAIAGVTYRITVDGFNAGSGAATGSFHLRIDRPPGNDSFPGQGIFGLPPIAADPEYNVGATRETGEPNHAGTLGGNSLWYSWTPLVTIPVQINTCFSGIDTVLAVYTGSSVNNLALVAQNDDTAACGFGGRGSRVRFTALGGVPYRIAVDGHGGAAGLVELQITGLPPANDNFASPIVLSGNTLFITGSIAAATAQVGEPSHGSPRSAETSVWYAWTASATGPVHIDTCTGAGTNFDTRLGVYTGTAVNALVAVATNDNSAGCGPNGWARWGSEVDFVAAAGDTYRIAVDGFNGVFGRFVLRLSFVPHVDTTTTTAPAPTTTTMPSGGGTSTTTTMPTGVPSTTTTFPTRTTATLLPEPGPCDAFADLARARCLIDEVLAGVLCQDSMRRHLERSLRRGLAGVSKKLGRAMLWNGPKQARVLSKVRIGMRRVGNRVATAAATARPRLSPTCAARLMSVVTEAQDAAGLLASDDREHEDRRIVNARIGIVHT